MSDGNVRATARLGLGSSFFFFDKRREARGERGPPSEEGSRRRQRGLVVRETYTVYHHRSSASYRGGVAFRGVRALVILFYLSPSSQVGLDGAGVAHGGDVV